MSGAEIEALASRVLDAARARGLAIATAESCTGGLIAGALSAIAGASDVLDRGFVTYSNAAKQEVLGVREKTLITVGAVSEAAARQMAAGAIRASRADLAVAVTGIAGPGGGTAEKPVGLVHLALARKDGGEAHRCESYGDLGRRGIREATVVSALEMLLAAMNDG